MTNNIGITKSEVVRAEFKNADFLAFNELQSRIAFDGNASARQTRELAIKFSVKFTTLAVRSALSKTDDLFISANENALYDLIVSGATQGAVARYEPLMAALEKLNKKVKPDDDAELVEVSREDFDAIITAFRTAKFD